MVTPGGISGSRDPVGNELIGRSGGVFIDIQRRENAFESMTASQLETRNRALLSDSVVRNLVKGILERVDASEAAAPVGDAEDDEEPGSVH